MWLKSLRRLTDHSSYPIRGEYFATIKKHDIRFHEEVKNGELSKVFYRKLGISMINQTFCVPVCDEYDDVDQMNPPVLLQLLLREMEWFEDADDYLIWCKDLGLDSTLEICRSIYFELREIVPQIREILGKELEAISDFDFELNTEITQALRASKM